jgi:hypothetical protein
MTRAEIDPGVCSLAYEDAERAPTSRSGRSSSCGAEPRMLSVAEKPAPKPMPQPIRPSPMVDETRDNGGGSSSQR